MTAWSCTSGFSAQVLSLERRACATEPTLLLSARDCPCEDRRVRRLDLATKLVPASETLALFIAVTKADDDAVDDVLV